MHIPLHVGVRIASAIALAMLAPAAFSQATLWDNGPLHTHRNAGCPMNPNPHDDSELQNLPPVSAASNGFNCSNNLFRLADDFILENDAIITSVTVYGYQTLPAVPTPGTTITQMFFRIWDGPPNLPGSATLGGSVMASMMDPLPGGSAFTGVYRSAATGPNVDTCVRPIMRATATFAPIEVKAGTRWLEWGMMGSAAGGVFTPPITVVGAWYPGNALQYVVSSQSWINANDTANQLQADFPFKIVGMSLQTPCELPLPCPCAADVHPTGAPNGVVNVDDLLAVIGTWGQDGNPNGPRPVGDAAPLPAGDCVVNVDDLLAVIGGWGACPTPTGACCMAGGSCVPGLSEAECSASGGVYQGACTICEGVICP